jgi:hypothetical protein
VRAPWVYRQSLRCRRGPFAARIGRVWAPAPRAGRVSERGDGGRSDEPFAWAAHKAAPARGFSFCSAACLPNISAARGQKGEHGKNRKGNKTLYDKLRAPHHIARQATALPGRYATPT